MKKFIPLNPSQVQAIKSFGNFFDSFDSEKEPPQKNSEEIPKGYIRATDLLTDQQKADLEKHEEKIQAGFNKYSAY